MAPGVVTLMVDDNDTVPAGGPHPEIVPFRLAKMKREDVVASPGVSWNEAVLVLLTWPVGPWGPAAVVGMATNPAGGLMTVLVTLVLPVTA